jgi:condensin complex subunit 2
MSSDALPVANKGKRRLSNLGAANALAEVETDEFETTNLSPFGGIGRRKSSIAPKSPAKGSREYAKQEELAEKYRLIIKLSSENKISAKNSWSLDLIDNMGEMIMNDASASRGVNFQKASCTIDASVKIYSHRVDDTWTSSMRVLENLSRNAHDESDEEEEENNDGDINKEKVSAKVGSKAASRRLDVSRTIEKNVANINSAQIEHQCTVDPMFHKMSKAFDEGGAKGMLMANLVWKLVFWYICYIRAHGAYVV